MSQNTQIDRLIATYSPQYVDKIRWNVQPEAAEGFQLRDGRDGVELSANSPLSLAVGLHHYWRNCCNGHFSWCGDQLQFPAEAPKVGKEVRHLFPLALRPYLNFCTFGYSMVWWDWARWEREIDFMALNGINMPLAVTGMEGVWLNTFRRFGIDDETICLFLSGPAFLPWQYMMNLDSHAGPMPMAWIDSHVELGQKILARERAWGMRPILPGYNGHVPRAFVEKYPEVAYIRNRGWCHFPAVMMINPADPMFRKVSEVFLEELLKLFGSDHYYSVDLFHEQELPCDDPEYLAQCGRGVIDTLKSLDPQAVWVMQAWSERPEIIRAVPPRDLLLLDIGKERLKTTDGLYGVPTVWGTIHSFGGQTEIGGDLAAIPREIAAQQTKFTNLVGAGAFPESITNNPVLFELVFDSALAESEIPLCPWVEAYAVRRYGQRQADALRAWTLMLRDVYTERRGDPVFAARPAIDTVKANAWAGFNVNDCAMRFFPAWGALLDAHAELADSDGYCFDVVDLGRQALSALGHDLFRRCQETFYAKDAPAFRIAADRFLNLILDCDELLACRREFRMDQWIADARKWGEGDVEKGYYEWNARLQISLWGPNHFPEPLYDYCCREWSGLLKEYYWVRWSKFFDFIVAGLEAGVEYDERTLPRVEGRIALSANEFYQELYEFECSFVRQTSPDRLVPRNQNEVATALRLYEKYRQAAEAAGVSPEAAATPTGDLLQGFDGNVPVVLTAAE